MHTTQTKNRIIEFIKSQGAATNAQLRQLTGITCVGVSKHLRELLDRGRIIKNGQHPRHTYSLSAQEARRQIEPDMQKAKEHAKQAIKASLEKDKEQVAQFNSQVEDSMLESIQQQLVNNKDIPEEVKAKMLEDLKRRITLSKKEFDI